MQRSAILASFESFPVGLTEITVLVMTLAVCLIILNARGSLLNRRALKDLKQFHSRHAQPVPRLGGVAIFVGFLLTILFFDDDFGGRHAKVLVSMLPMVAVTLWEDMLRPTLPRIRLAGVLISCTFTLGSLQVWLTSIDVPVIDPLMPGIAGFLITTAFVLGNVNGFNMIDGLNGLCAGASLATLITFCFIAQAVGYEFMVNLTMAFGAAVAGFLVFNFPRARLFLGDTGTYVIGYLTALFGISICYRYPAVSPWSIFLILGYPLSDVGITFFRRLLAGVSPLRPDNLHLHHLLLQRVQQFQILNKLHAYHNPITSLLIFPIAVGPMILAATKFNSPHVLQVGAVAYGMAMIGLYALLRLNVADTNLERVGANQDANGRSSSSLRQVRGNREDQFSERRCMDFDRPCDLTTPLSAPGQLRKPYDAGQ